MSTQGLYRELWGVVAGFRSALDSDGVQFTLVKALRTSGMPTSVPEEPKVSGMDAEAGHPEQVTLCSPPPHEESRLC